MSKKPVPRKTGLQLLSPEMVKEKPLCPISGSRYEEVRQTLYRQITGSLWVEHSNVEQVNQQIIGAMAQAMGIKPQDEAEGMLAAQMVACHNATMECYRRAMLPEQSFEGRNLSLNHAGKLSRTFAALMEALNRHRGKGQQKMTVEHVHVYPGGQAIVGTVNHSPQGGGVKPKTEEQPHAKQITHAPEPAMPCPDAKRQPLPVSRDA